MKNIDIQFSTGIISLSYEFVVSTNLRELIKNNSTLEETLIKVCKNTSYGIHAGKLIKLISNILLLFDSYYTESNKIESPSLKHILTGDYSYNDYSSIVYITQRFGIVHNILKFLQIDESIIIQDFDWKSSISWMVGIMKNNPQFYLHHHIVVEELSKYSEYCNDESLHINQQLPFQVTKLKNNKMIIDSIRNNLSKGIFSHLRFIST